jgi:hypothetical protein
MAVADDGTTGRPNNFRPAQSSRLYEDVVLQVQKMIAGKMEPSEVVESMKGGGKSVLFYGHLYLGLFFDAKKDLVKAKEHLTKCVEVKYPGYMYDVAKLHLKMLEESSPTETKPGQR